VLSVSDNGRGIAADERGRVQQRFYRSASADSSGSGLGLSIVSRIAELHGGSIEFVHPTADSGASLRVLLPAA
jgi:signal transduction histidine kinase